MQWNLSDLTWLCVFWISSLLLFMLSTPQSHHSGCREITNDDESFWYGWRMRFVEWSLLYHTSEGTYPLLYSTYCSRFFLSGPIKPWCVHIECILGNSSVWDDPRAVHMFFFPFFWPKIRWLITRFRTWNNCLPIAFWGFYCMILPGRLEERSRAAEAASDALDEIHAGLDDPGGFLRWTRGYEKLLFGGLQRWSKGVVDVTKKKWEDDL